MVRLVSIAFLAFGLAAMSEADEQEVRAVPRAPRDDLNSWTLWSRSAEGAWTPGAVYMPGRRRCIEYLDLLERLYVGSERTSKTALLISRAAVRSARDRGLARGRLPNALSTELRCLPYYDDPSPPLRK